MLVLTNIEFLEALAQFIEKRDKIQLDRESMSVDRVSEHHYEFIVSDNTH